MRMQKKEGSFEKYFAQGQIILLRNLLKNTKKNDAIWCFSFGIITHTHIGIVDDISYQMAYVMKCHKIPFYDMPSDIKCHQLCQYGYQKKHFGQTN